MKAVPFLVVVLLGLSLDAVAAETADKATRQENVKAKAKERAYQKQIAKEDALQRLIDSQYPRPK